MSLNKFSDNNIKPYLKLGCQSINTNQMFIGGFEFFNIFQRTYIPTVTITSCTVNNAFAYAFIYHEYITINVTANVTVNSPTSSVFLSIGLPLFIYGDVDVPVCGVTNFVSTIGGIAGLGSLSILQNQNTVYTNIQSPSNYTIGSYVLNASYTIKRVY